jgi:hypothetical protein
MIGGDDGGADEVLFDLLAGGGATEPDPEVEAAWSEEVRRRMRAAAEGREMAIPGEEVMVQARARIWQLVEEERQAEPGLE